MIGRLLRWLVKPPKRHTPFIELLLREDRSTFTASERSHFERCMASHRHAAKLGREDQKVFRRADRS